MNFIKNLFKKESSKSDTVSFEPTELQIAVSKILVRTAKIDDEFHILEEQKILELLTKYFSLNDEDSKNLVKLGISEEKSATDLYAYTNTIKKSLELNERKKIIEMMWQIIVTDDNFDPYENNLVWRVAELIGISTRERVQIRKDFLSTLNG
ncbi:MAG: TerB family tellurite resistance protein [Hyphomicrobiales bacterium]